MEDAEGCTNRKCLWNTLIEQPNLTENKTNKIKKIIINKAKST